MKMKKKMKTKVFLGVLLSLALVLGLLPALLPGMNLTAKAAATPTYKIVVTSPAFNRTYSENIELPQTFTGAWLLSYMNFPSVTVNSISKAGGDDIVSIDGTSVTVNGAGTVNLNINVSGGHGRVGFIVTKNITASATGYDGSYDGNDHGISVDVSIPASGATVKYGTQNGTYDLTESPKYKDAGTYTVYYQVTADDYNTKTGSAQVKIAKLTPSITAAPTASAITYGQTLANSTLTGGAASVAGTFAWKDSTAAPAVANSNSTEYAVVFTPTDTANYNTAECKVKLAVAPADPTVPTGLTATYGQTLADVTLPAGWTWADSAQSVGNAGLNTFKANYTATSANYNSKSNVNVSVTVGKANASVTVAPAAKENLTYNDSAQELVTSGIAKGGVMQYALGNETAATSSYTSSVPTGTDAKTYYVWYKVAGNSNYNEYVGTQPVSVTIAKADPEIPTGLVGEVGDTLGDVTLPENWSWADHYERLDSAGIHTFKANYASPDANHNNMRNINVEVKVVTVPVTGVTLDKTELTLKTGETAALTATVLPANATDKVLKWQSSDESVVSVDENGNMTALVTGTATITVTTEDGGYTAECHITTVIDTATVTFKVKSGNGHKYRWSSLAFTFIFAEDKADSYDYESDFKEARLKGKNYPERVLKDREFTVENGSLKITVKRNLLSTLKPGAYTLTVVLKSGSSASATFTVPGEGEGVPNTGDYDMTDGLVFAMILFLLSLAIIVLRMAYAHQYFRAKLLAVPAGIATFFSGRNAIPAAEEDDSLEDVTSDEPADAAAEDISD